MATDSGALQRERTQRPGARIAFVVSTFHHELTAAMLRSARAELEASGLAPGDMPVISVPGSFELPLVARRCARHTDIDAVICLGLVLKGETSHDIYVAQAATQGLAAVMLETDKPVLLGVLTCNTLEQARARALAPAEGGVQDKGRELAIAAVEMLAALDEADQRAPRSAANSPVSSPASSTK